MSLDRDELAFAAKELCRDFAAPNKKSWERLKRVVRFLVGQPRVVWWYRWQDRPDYLEGYVDTDFAGCHRTRRSTSGGIALHGQHPIKHWSSTQTTVALSSGEAELGGICKGSSICIGLQSIARDLGFQWQLKMFTDAIPAIGINHRRGLGKVRHLAVADLWVQDKVRAGKFLLEKVLGSENPADMCTKYIGRYDMNKHLRRISCEWESGRAGSAPTVEG